MLCSNRCKSDLYQNFCTKERDLIDFYGQASLALLGFSKKDGTFLQAIGL